MRSAVTTWAPSRLLSLESRITYGRPRTPGPLPGLNTPATLASSILGCFVCDGLLSTKLERWALWRPPRPRGYPPPAEGNRMHHVRQCNLGHAPTRVKLRTRIPSFTLIIPHRWTLMDSRAVRILTSRSDVQRDGWTRKVPRACRAVPLTR
ncbi:hypothetical protein BD310DRAFT_579671 [Dichomitus squalens]|uniref:Uncharacterized protein n=1 Tax=Dichomitus squalens TaxID=114155 RepID=A0A4Q9Q9Y6_9APHY|nr:hypothetical protein BD310DRAFT_579671 [Dichomitus squalens]